MFIPIAISSSSGSSARNVHLIQRRPNREAFSELEKFKKKQSRDLLPKHVLPVEVSKAQSNFAKKGVQCSTQHTTQSFSRCRISKGG